MGSPHDVLVVAERRDPVTSDSVISLAPRRAREAMTP